jgi:hypothetical protein
MFTSMIVGIYKDGTLKEDENEKADDTIAT